MASLEIPGLLWAWTNLSCPSCFLNPYWSRGDGGWLASRAKTPVPDPWTSRQPPAPPAGPRIPPGLSSPHRWWADWNPGEKALLLREWEYPQTAGVTGVGWHEGRSRFSADSNSLQPEGPMTYSPTGSVCACGHRMWKNKSEADGAEREPEALSGSRREWVGSIQCAARKATASKAQCRASGRLERGLWMELII